MVLSYDSFRGRGKEVLKAYQENSNLALAASQQAQTANIVSQLRAPAPVPAYIVQNPNCCTTPTVAVTAAPACAGTLF